MSEPAALLEVLPRADRLRIRVLCGSLHMLEKQVRGLPIALAERIGLPPAETVRRWHLAAVLMHASSINGP